MSKQLAETIDLIDLVEGVSQDVMDGVQAFVGFEVMNRLAKEDLKVWHHFCRGADWWQMTSRSLQLSIFIAAGRLFPTKSVYDKSMGLPRLRDAIASRPAALADSVFRASMRNSSRLPRRQMHSRDFSEFMEIPSAQQVEQFDSLVKQAASFYEGSAYEELRKKHYAHREYEPIQRNHERFDGTARAELENIFKYSFLAVSGLIEFVEGGREVAWDSTKRYEMYRSELEAQFESAILASAGKDQRA